MSHDDRPIQGDFFSRDWQERLPVVIDLVKEISHHSDPSTMGWAYARRMWKLFPSSRRISLSRRGLAPAQFRITRDSHWTELIDPWREPNRLPLYDGGLFGELIYGNEPRIINDLVVDSSDPARHILVGHRSLLAIPLYDQGEGINMVVTLQRQPGAFSPEHLPEQLWLANLFGRATMNQVLSRQLREALDELDEEMQKIGRIQNSMLPAKMPDVPGLDVAIYYQTSRKAGGDYYDFFPLRDGMLGILIADVSGHGTPAAVHMAITHSLARTYAGDHMPPHLLLSHLNRELCRHYTATSGTFVTVFYAVYDPRHAMLTYCSAGHNPAQVVRCSDGTRMTLDQAQRLPVGVIETEEYISQEFPLVPGDQIILYTDGITEAMNPDGKMFTSERLSNVLTDCPVGAQAVLERVLTRLSEFTAGNPAEDDRTLLVAKYTGREIG